MMTDKLRELFKKIFRRSNSNTKKSDQEDNSSLSYVTEEDNQAPPTPLNQINSDSTDITNPGIAISDNDSDEINFRKEIGKPLTIKEKIDQASIRLNDFKNRWMNKSFGPRTLRFPKSKQSDKIHQEEREGESASHKNKWSKDHLVLSLQNFKNRILFYNWESLGDDLLHPARKPIVHRIFFWLLLLVLPYQFGKIIGIFFTPTDNLFTSASNINLDKKLALDQGALLALKNAEVFKTEKKDNIPNEENKVESPKICETATQSSSLNFNVLSTTVLQNKKKSMVSLLFNNKEAIEGRIGDNLKGQAIIGAIEPWRVIIKNTQTGECEYLDGRPQGPRNDSRIAVLSKKESVAFNANKKIDGIENDGNTFKIKKDFLKSKLGNLNDILTQARGIPMNNPDGTMSFKIVDIEPGGVFSYLGIQNNDVITQINGKKITNLNEVMSLFGKITSLSDLQIVVNRQGEETPLDYKLQ